MPNSQVTSCTCTVMHSIYSAYKSELINMMSSVSHLPCQHSSLHFLASSAKRHSCFHPSEIYSTVPTCPVSSRSCLSDPVLKPPMERFRPALCQCHRLLQGVTRTLLASQTHESMKASHGVAESGARRHTAPLAVQAYKPPLKGSRTRSIKNVRPALTRPLESVLSFMRRDMHTSCM